MNGVPSTRRPGLGWLIKALSILGFPSKGGASLPRVIAQGGPVATLTGTTAETVLATIPIPAGTLGVNGALRISTLWSFNNSANGHDCIVKIGAATIMNHGIGGQLTLDAVKFMRNRGSLTSQAVHPSASIGQGSGIAVSILNVDMGQAQTLTICGRLASGGADTITLEGYTVEVLNP